MLERVMEGSAVVELASQNDSDAKEEIILGAGEVDANEVIEDSEGDEASSVGDIANDEGDIEVVNRE